MILWYQSRRGRGWGILFLHELCSIQTFDDLKIFISHFEGMCSFIVIGYCCRGKCSAVASNNFKQLQRYIDSLQKEKPCYGAIELNWPTKVKLHNLSSTSLSVVEI